MKERICRLIQAGEESGARLVLDGRNIEVCPSTYLSMIILLHFSFCPIICLRRMKFFCDVVGKIVCWFSHLNHCKFRMKAKYLM